MQTRSLTPATLFSLALALLLLPAPVTQAAAKSAAEPAFGQKLARAASAQRWVPVIYNPAYVKLKYPGGDVPWYTGVCTDVVVRAYRKLGIDLQVKVHKARVGSGDRNIDHRRVNVLRKFFKRHGTSLKVTKNPKNYKPGDLVTYYMPDGTFSKTHIAIVSEQKASDGTPLVIHNRGFGVQLENWLFAEKITGHYRYR
ncbi:MAG: DUF1287 domain-containing protein [Pseudomonadota bacterium]